MDIESIKKNYRNFEDYQIIELANTSANSLRPEIIPILEEEIKRRNLSENLLKGIQVQLKEPTPDEIQNYLSIVRQQSCSECHSKTQKLNAFILTNVRSAIFVTTTRKQLKLACPDCLEKFKSGSTQKNLLLGWWAFPWGPIKTIQSLLANHKAIKSVREDKPSDILVSFVYQNIGKLETDKDNPNALKHFLSQTNNLS